MNRQKLRKTLVIISFLLFPVTIYYFSPYLVIQGASEGIITGSFIVFCLLFLVSLFLGRGFCGWVCPAGGLQECMTLGVDKKTKGGKLNWIKYGIWIPWMIIILVFFFSAGGIKEIDFLYQTTYGISVVNPLAYIVYYGVVFLIVTVSLVGGKRGFCHYVCWMAPFMVIGTKIKDALKIPSLHLSANSENCISCKQCSKKCSMSLDVDQMVEKGNMKNSECILCGECVANCPKSVIKFSIK